MTIPCHAVQPRSGRQKSKSHGHCQCMMGACKPYLGTQVSRWWESLQGASGYIHTSQSICSPPTGEVVLYNHSANDEHIHVLYQYALCVASVV